MTLRDLVLKDYSKSNAIRVRDYILNKPEEIEELIQLCLFKKQQISERAIYSVSHIFDAQPELVRPFKKELISRVLEDDCPAPMKRNILRILPQMSIPKILQADLVKKCYTYLLNPNEAIAVRAHAISVIYSISQSHPELLSELKYTLALVQEREQLTKGILARIRKILS